MPDTTKSLTTDVSRETMDGLVEFSELVHHWTKRINLVSAADAPLLWDRHIMDSAQLYDLAPLAWKTWLDVGCGGGFPGIVVAIIAKANNPTGQVTLVESDLRKAAFLRTAIRELDLHAKVHAVRIEELAPQGADVVSARALANLTRLIDLTAPHLDQSGIALFPKGRQAATEITQAQREWQFDLEILPSMTNSESSILRLRGLARV